MANKNRKNLITDERIEDNTMYGENVPSMHQWISMDKQKKRVKRIEDVTRGDTPKGN